MRNIRRYYTFNENVRYSFTHFMMLTSNLVPDYFIKKHGNNQECLRNNLRRIIVIIIPFVFSCWQRIKLTSGKKEAPQSNLWKSLLEWICIKFCFTGSLTLRYCSKNILFLVSLLWQNFRITLKMTFEDSSTTKLSLISEQIEIIFSNVASIYFNDI